MTKHTPGPWATYVNTNNDVTIRKMFPDGQECCEITRCKSGFANALLITAAPELLKIAISNAEYRAARDSEFGRGFNAAKNGQSRNTQVESEDWYAGYDARSAIAKATQA